MTFFMTEQSKIWIDEYTLRVMTYKSGVFTFGLKLDITASQAMIDRINDAQTRFNKMPMLPQIIDKIQEKVLVSSIYSTNTIEGGEFSQDETEKILKTDPLLIQKSEEKRLTNLKQAIHWVKQHGSPQLMPNAGQIITLHDILNLHDLVSQQVDEINNPPRQFRNNQPTQKTLVGNAAHGGTYRPPKCLTDIEYLMSAWLEWLNSPALLTQSALIRASLAHYYFEIIHPFWDGNGRTGRLLEMLILEQAGYRFSSSAIWQHYQENIHQYFSLFNHCRKLADKKAPFAYQDFIDFMLDGMLNTINKLHDQVNDLIHFLLYKNALNEARNTKQISERQFQLIELYINFLKTDTVALSPSELYKKPIIQTLFYGKTERTYFRDIEKLIKIGFLQDKQGKLSF